MTGHGLGSTRGQDKSPAPLLLGPGSKVINIGLESFAESLEAQQASVIRVRWRPPQVHPEDIRSLLQKMR